MNLQAYFLDKYVDEESISIETNNRSFLYGDGLFETIIVKNGAIRLWEYHFDRLTEGLKVLGININPLPDLEVIIKKLLSINNLDNARVKVHVWRSAGGLYQPLNNEPQLLVTMKAWGNEQRQPIETIGFSDKVFLSSSMTSRFKTNNSLPYVLAAIERKERKLDELVIMDNHDNISECTSSNIFWTDGVNYYTPSLSTGCIEGIMRRHVITTAKAHQIEVVEGEFKKDHLIKSASAFCCNATGVVPILQVEGHTLQDNCNLIPLLEL